MILLDSSVVVDLFRAQDDRILDVILEHDAAICGISRAEVLYGARDASFWTITARSFRLTNHKYGFMVMA